MGINRVLGPDFVGQRNIGEIDDDYVNAVLDKLEYGSEKHLRQIEAETMANATAELVRSDDITRDIAKYRHMSLLLDLDFFIEERSPHMMTSSKETHELLLRSGAVRAAYKAYKASTKNGSQKERVEAEHKAILTAWNVVFNDISHYSRLAHSQESVA